MPAAAEPSPSRRPFGLSERADQSEDLPLSPPRSVTRSPLVRQQWKALARRWGGPTVRNYWVRLLPVLLVLAAVVRIPSFQRSVWNPDEGFLATQARMLADGGTLYETVVDRKPPLLPWLYQISFAVFGDTTLVPLKVAAVLAVAATAALVAAIARGRWGNRAGWLAGPAYVLVSVGLNPEDAQSAAFEVFMLPFTVAAVWCADRRRWGWAGLAIAGAVLTKQTGGAVLLPVLYLLWRQERATQRSVPLLRLGCGMALPVLALALLLGPGRFLFWMVTGSGSYASITGSEIHVLGRALANAALVGLACAGLIAPVVRICRQGRSEEARVAGAPSRQPLGADLWLWLAGSVLAVVMGFHFFGHYYLQLLPSVVLLGTGALRLLPAERLRSAALCCCLSATVFVSWGVIADDGKLRHAERVAAAVREHSHPQDTVLLWGMHPEGYWLSERTPASRFLTAGFLTNFSGGRDSLRVGQQYAVKGSWRAFRKELVERPPQVIVDDSRGQPYRPARVPAFRSYLTAHYERVQVLTGGTVVYVRED